MNKFKRIQRALEGRAIDRVPVSAWYHFGSEHLPPAVVAKLHADYQAVYGWDFLKVMFDYRLHYSDMVDNSAGIDLQLMLETTDWRAPFRLQSEVLQTLRAEMGSSVPLVETVYSPWMYLIRHIGRDLKERLLECPDLLAQVLARLTEETCRHVLSVRNMGCYGIYFATLAAEDSVAGLAVAPYHHYDLDVLNAASGLVLMLHLHGSPLYPAAVGEYPRDVLHWDNRDPNNPSLTQLRADNRCLMGGLAPSTLTGVSMSALRRQVREAIIEAGTKGFILAPGCSVPSSLSFRKMLALRDPALLAA